MPVHMTEYAIGLDLSGAGLRAAAIDKSGTLLEKVSGATRCEEGREAVLSTIAAAIDGLRATLGADGLRGIGVGVPGFIRMKEGLIANSTNLSCLENVPIRDVLSSRLKTRVILENDANAAVLGEKWMGAGRDVDDLVLLTLGTGIGGGIISGGRIVRGRGGMAGEFGHISVVPNGNPCGCGNRGCLEKHASAEAVSAMARLMQLGENLSATEIYQLASQNTEAGEKARVVWQVAGEALGMAMAVLVNTFNFPLYLLGGTMLPAWKYFAPHMIRVLSRRSFTFRATAHETRIAPAKLGDMAGLYGAAYLPWVEK